MNVDTDLVSINAGWSFSGNIVSGFDNHVANSVPLYKQGHDLILGLSDFFLSKNSLCYDIGSSTGQLIKDLSNHNKEKKCQFIGVDVESDMVLKAKELHLPENISFICDDILNIELKKCDLIISYYTLQFVKPSVRQIIFNKVYDSLNWGGAFILFEKVRANDARFQDITTALYNEFKLNNGFTPEQIFNKTRSLKGILEPFSTQGNIDLLNRAGFIDILSIMKYINFEGFLAIK